MSEGGGAVGTIWERSRGPESLPGLGQVAGTLAASVSPSVEWGPLSLSWATMCSRRTGIRTACARVCFYCSQTLVLVSVASGTT